MGNIKDPNEKYNLIRGQVIDMLIEYDEYTRDSHANLIQTAEHMTKGTPMEIREREPDEPIKHYKYMTSPIFRLTVEKVTNYIMNNIKD